VDSVTAARRMGAPVESFRTTPLIAANGARAGACAGARPGVARKTEAKQIQPTRMYPIVLDRHGAPLVPNNRESGGALQRSSISRLSRIHEKPIHLPQIPTADHSRIEITAATLPHSGPTRPGSASATLRIAVNVKSIASRSEIIFTQNAP